MTVTYTDKIATAKGLTLLKLIFCKWRGSLLRLVWKDLLLFLSAHYFIQIIYLFLLSDEGRDNFRSLISYAKNYQEIIPLNFVLGFFVSMVTARWWNQFESIPWPTAVAVYVSSTLHGYDEVGRAMRRTILRYVNLSLVMVFRVLSPRVQTRFPRMEDLITAGFINESELSILQALEDKFPGYSKNWLPICWAASIATRARGDGRIKDDFALKTIIKELNSFRAKCGSLMNYATICIPLVYVQVVSIAVYTYFLTQLIAKQPLPTPLETVLRAEGTSNYYLQCLPFLISIQFLFYMGWLKVAETMINPFGDDDDDFEVNSMIDRNLIMSYLIVDDMHNEHPELLKDCYWNEIPKSLPDRGRLYSKGVESNNITDFFNVHNESGQFLVISGDEQMPVTSSPSIESRADKVPRSSVIDESYRHISNVEVTQSVIDRNIQHVRERILSRQISETSSVLSSSSSIVKDDTIR